MARLRGQSTSNLQFPTTKRCSVRWELGFGSWEFHAIPRRAAVIGSGRMAPSRGALMRTSFILTAAGACAVAVLSGDVLSAQRGPQVPPMVKEGATEKISDHVYVIPDGSVSLVPNITIVVGSR